MYATTFRFAASGNLDWEQMRHQLVRLAFDMSHQAHGLHSAALTLSPERREFGGSCAWENRDVADAFLRSDLWERTIARYGQPRLERAEICAHIEEGDVLFPADFDERLAGTQLARPTAR